MAVTSAWQHLYRRHWQGLYLEHPIRPLEARDPLESVEPAGSWTNSGPVSDSRRVHLGYAAFWSRCHKTPCQV